jgi:hypothetical protein
MGKMSEIDAGYQSAMQFRELGNNESESELVANKEMQGVNERSNQYDEANTWEELDKFDNSYEEDKAPTIPNSLSSIKVATYYYVTDDGSLGLDIESMATEFNEKMENVEQAFIELNNKNKYTYNDEGKLIRRNNAS